MKALHHTGLKLVTVVTQLPIERNSRRGIARSVINKTDHPIGQKGDGYQPLSFIECSAVRMRGIGVWETHHKVRAPGPREWHAGINPCSGAT